MDLTFHRNRKQIAWTVSINLTPLSTSQTIILFFFQNPYELWLWLLKGKDVCYGIFDRLTLNRKEKNHINNITVKRDKSKTRSEKLLTGKWFKHLFSGREIKYVPPKIGTGLQKVRWSKDNCNRKFKLMEWVKYSQMCKLRGDPFWYCHQSKCWLRENLFDVLRNRMWEAINPCNKSIFSLFLSLPCPHDK